MMAPGGYERNDPKSKPLREVFQRSLEGHCENDSVLVVSYEYRLRLYSQNDKRNGRASPAMPENVVQFTFVIRDSA